MSRISLFVNGIRHDLTVPADTPLLPVLRQELGLKGTRFGCGEARCGACTVLVDGKSQHACVIQLWAVEGKAITTIEGLVEDETLAAIPRTFIEEQAAQCGYCINGIMMSLASLLALEPRPSRAEVLEFLDERHLCRCGSHPRILRAIDRLLASAGISK